MLPGRLRPDPRPRYNLRTPHSLPHQRQNRSPRNIIRVKRALARVSEDVLSLDLSNANQQCIYFFRGNCQRGEKCKYEHQVGDDGQPIPVAPEIIKRFEDAVKRYGEPRAQAKPKAAPRGGVSSSMLILEPDVREHGITLNAGKHPLCPCNKAEREHARGDVLKNSVLSSFIVSSVFSESRGDCGHAKLRHDV